MTSVWLEPLTAAMLVPFTVPALGFAVSDEHTEDGSKRTARILVTSSPRPVMVICGEDWIADMVVGENDTTDAAGRK